LHAVVQYISYFISGDILGDLLLNVLNIGRFLLQMIWRTIFPISYRQQAKKEISADISADSADI